MKSAKTHMLAWSPETGDVRLVEWPSKEAVKTSGMLTCLACDFETRRLDFEKRKCVIFIEAMHLIVRDGIDPMKLHGVLMELEEYRDAMSGDMPGMSGV